MSSSFKPASDLSSWKGATQPNHKDILKGRFVSLEPLSLSRHPDLYRNLSDPELWNYMINVPEMTSESFYEWIKSKVDHPTQFLYSIIDNKTDEALGWISLIKVSAEYGNVEIGNVTYSKKIQRTVKSSESFYLLARHCFRLGFRRVEWKCNSKNEVSKKAAIRYGFTYEGTFRKHMVLRGQNRDSTWFSLLDDEWERVGKAFEDWLSDENMSENGIQKESLKAAALY